MSQSKLINLSFLTFMNNAAMNILCMCAYRYIYKCLNLHIFYIWYIYLYTLINYIFKHKYCFHIWASLYI